MNPIAPTVPAATDRDSPQPGCLHETPGNGFDRIARAYRWLEYLCFGRTLQRCRTLQLEQIPGAALVLVLGDGDGRFTAALLARHRQSQVFALDASAAMLALLSARARQIEASGRLQTLQGDVLGLLSASPLPAEIASGGAGPFPQRRFDCVCSHFFLDCLTSPEVEQLARLVVPRLAPGGSWIISEFETPAWWARQIVSALYLAFALLAGLRVRRLPAWRKALAQQGLICVAQARLRGGLLSSSLWRHAQGTEEPRP